MFVQSCLPAISMPLLKVLSRIQGSGAKMRWHYDIMQKHCTLLKTCDVYILLVHSQTFNVYYSLKLCSGGIDWFWGYIEFNVSERAPAFIGKERKTD